jgi:hypothetical protein
MRTTQFADENDRKIANIGTVDEQATAKQPKFSARQTV